MERPIKPRKPSKPIKPKKYDVSFIDEVIIDTDVSPDNVYPSYPKLIPVKDLSNLILESIRKNPSFKEKLKVFVGLSRKENFDPDNVFVSEEQCFEIFYRDHNVRSQYSNELEKYHRRLEKYESKLEKYEDDLKKYKINLELYNAWRIKKQEDKFKNDIINLQKNLTVFKKKKKI